MGLLYLKVRKGKQAKDGMARSIWEHCYVGRNELFVF